ncbi:polyphosphate polymerase domain-containing protein [Anaerofustis sp.]|uniref:polyphosphate polymerase domain-containing protein n=1 Tax=Anaerofustis sp. TaxID=1872517 RepID=UPI0025B9FD3A|nr:polyphosphate polymerase domain-containing protein [Anaerofustis sp.]
MNDNSRLLSVARREVKYLIGLEDRLFVLDSMDKILTPDVYGGYNGYTVRSVYFDSYYNDDYIEKRVKMPDVKRIRMRVYNPDDKNVKFELKQKSYGRELKESLLITRDDAQRLLDKDYSVLLKYNSSIAKYAYDLMSTRCYRPVSLVEYDRRAYTHENFNTRVTLDNNLRYCDFNYELFSHNLNFKAAMAKEDTILEIKYDRFLFKQIQDILKQCDLNRKPPSKFGTSRDILNQYYY